MATIHDSSIKFFSKASSDQWLYVLSQYKEVFKQRAQATRGSKKSGPQEAIKLDNWYQEELPKILLARKDKHVRHEELVQITKWKLWRTKNRAGLLDLVRMNTELAVKQVSTKAFKKCPSNLHGAISALVNLKGIGVATASAVLCACFPEICPFMADECLDSVPGIENTNYTVNEFIAFADQIKACCERLQAEDPSAKWTPHKVELTLWTHYWIKEMKLNLLEKMPTSEGLEEDETEETGSSIDDNNISRNNGGSHVKLSSTSSSNGGVSGRVVDEDSNISVPVSNASEVDDDDDSRSVDASIGGKNNNGTCSSSNSSRLMMMNNSNTNSNSAYNCIEDSKDGMVRSSSSIVDENSRQQMLSNGDNSNLSYSNLSSDDLNNSTTENTTDNGMDCPTNLSMPTGSNNKITGSSVESSTSSSSTTSTTTTSSTTINTSAAAVSITTAINNNNDNSITSDVTSSTLTPPLPQAPVVATPVVVVTHPEIVGETSTVVPVVGTTSLEAESGTSNGHIASNGESYNGVDNEIKSDKVCSSSNNTNNTNNSINRNININNNDLKRPVEEITSSGDDLKDDGISEKKTRIE